MKRFIFLFVLILFALDASFAQEYIPPVEEWSSEEIQGSNYHGWLFHQNWDVDFTIDDQDGRYTPSEEEIAKAEKLIQKRIAYLNREHINQSGKCPLIDEHMLKYERQYVGFTDVKGYHIIWCNFIWDEAVAAKLGEDILLTKGGCGHYWHIKCNVDTEKVFDLEVNESGSVNYLPRVKKPGPRISRPKKPANPKKIRKTGIMHDPAYVTF